MGNACGCADDKTPDAGVATISKIAKPGQAFSQANFQSKISTAAFGSIPTAEKDKLLAEIFQIILSNGDVSKIKSQNAHLKTAFAKTNAKFTTPRGDTYEGEVIDGVAYGKGKVTHPTGPIGSYEGTFVDGREHGLGVVHMTDGSEVRSETFCRGQPLGHCTQIFKDKAKEERFFARGGELTGPYVQTDAAGTSYFGSYKDGNHFGTQVSVSKDKTLVSVVEYTGGKASAPKPFVPSPASVPGNTVTTTAPVAKAK